jgi:hypothetical protein
MAVRSFMVVDTFVVEVVAFWSMSLRSCGGIPGVEKQNEKTSHLVTYSNLAAKNSYRHLPPKYNNLNICVNLNYFNFYCSPRFSIFLSTIYDTGNSREGGYSEHYFLGVTS